MNGFKYNYEKISQKGKLKDIEHRRRVIKVDNYLGVSIIWLIRISKADLGKKIIKRNNRMFQQN